MKAIKDQLSEDYSDTKEIAFDYVKTKLGCLIEGKKLKVNMIK